MHNMNADKAYRQQARQEQHKKIASYIEQIPETTPHKTAVVQPPTSYL